MKNNFYITGKNKLFITLFCFVISVSSFAQIRNGESVFNDEFVHEVRLVFSQPHFLDTLLANYEAVHDSIPVKKTSLMASVFIDGKKADSVGVKLKGVNSYTILSDKKPIKLDFNEFNKMKNFDGLLNLNLSNEFPDPSMLRNSVAYKIMRDAGVRAPRTAFAKVYMNDVYIGLYALIEQLDKAFFTNYFSNSSGELIKPRAGFLFWQANDTLSFSENYEIKSGKNSEALTRLISFARKINTTPSIIFYDSLKNTFDFDSYIPVFAADIIFNNQDCYFQGLNYYLYWNRDKKKYYFLPWDYQFTFTAGEKSEPPYQILPGDENASPFVLPLTSKIIDNDTLRKKYLDCIYRINELMSANSLENYIYNLHELIKPALLADTNKGMTIDQFDQSLLNDTRTSEYYFDGLLTFIRYRHEQINNMLKQEGYDKNENMKK